MKRIFIKQASLRGTKRRDRKSPSPGLEIQPQQITVALLPGLLTRALVDKRVESGAYLGRPYSVWKNDPELARMVNDRLADEALN
jgi:hypothetical protein